MLARKSKAIVMLFVNYYYFLVYSHNLKMEVFVVKTKQSKHFGNCFQENCKINSNLTISLRQLFLCHPAAMLTKLLNYSLSVMMMASCIPQEILPPWCKWLSNNSNWVAFIVLITKFCESCTLKCFIRLQCRMIQ